VDVLAVWGLVKIVRVGKSLKDFIVHMSLIHASVVLVCIATISASFALNLRKL
jgi:hypothetical protein